MSVTTFLSNETYWQKLSDCIQSARHIDAAIAYLGQNGSKLLPLRKGDRLIVDMSQSTVKAGSTDPREVEKLIQRGVQVFTRRNLHAKIIVSKNSVISGSANISKHSQQNLDEAAIFTNDKSAVRRAREFIDRLCTEPVRPEYLEECKRIYKPPRFIGNHFNGKRSQKRITHAKLWIVNLSEGGIPNSENELYKQGEKKAEKLIKNKIRSKTESFSWSRKPRIANELELGDWIIQIIKHKDNTIVVHPPAQFLLIDSYVRDSKTHKKRYVFHLEVPKREETLTWKEYRRAARSVLTPKELASPRTKPIRDVQVADKLLALWTAAGRVSRRRER